MDVGVVGASGYTGAELLRLCAAHPAFEVRVATADTQAGTGAAALYPGLAAAYARRTRRPPGRTRRIAIFSALISAGRCPKEVLAVNGC